MFFKAHQLIVCLSLLAASGDPDGRSSVISVDLEEEDLFEKARKKYGVQMDSDDDDDADLNDRKYL